MKTTCKTALATALVAASLLATAAELPDPVPLRLIGINDLHGHLEEASSLQLLLTDPAARGAAPMRVQVGGAAAMGGLVKRLRAGSPYSAMVAAGDLFGGSPLISTLFRHESTVDILNDMGLDVSSVGNHEFDAGFAELQRLVRGGCAANRPEEVTLSCPAGPYRGARFAYLGANVLDTNNRPAMAPYLIKNYAGIPVAFIGGVTRATPEYVTAFGVAGLRFIDEADAVNRAADELRRKGIRAMVAIFHEGISLGRADEREWNNPACPGARGPMLDIARRLAPEIRVIFTGHTHQGYRCELEGRLLISGTSYSRAVSVVDVELDRSTRAMLPPVRSFNLPVINEKTDPAQREKLAADAPAPYGAALREAKPDTAIAAKIARYVALAAPKANKPVARIGGAFVRGGPTDSAAGRLIADAQLEATKGDAVIAFMNRGGIRTDLECATPPCTVTFGQIFTMQPFGNSLVTMTLTGAQIKQLLEEQFAPVAGGTQILQPSAGFTYTWQSDAAVGQRARDIVLNGQPIDPGRAYRVTVNTFLADGGDGFATLRGGTDRKGGGQDLDALLAYLAAQERSPIPTPRMTRR